MRSVLLSPHADDETLFTAYSILRHQPHVIVCLYESEVRMRESHLAVTSLGTTFEQWQTGARNPSRYKHLETQMQAIRGTYEHVFAPNPSFDENGHSEDAPSKEAFGILDHDWVGALALRIWGPERTTLYQTYTRWGGRVREGTEVLPESRWIALKLRALSYYQSQHALPSTVSWFTQPDLREWLA
jgi:hypothetical protein